MQVTNTLFWARPKRLAMASHQNFIKVKGKYLVFVLEQHSIKTFLMGNCAGAALYRRSVFNDMGYFDENFFAYMEDVDIGYRARIYGYKSLYCPQAIVYHVGSGTSGSKYNAFKIRLAARNNVYVPYKNMPWPQLAVNMVFLIMGYFIKYLFFLRKGHGKDYINGLKDGLSSLNKIKRIKYKNGRLTNYLSIEWFLIKNTVKSCLIIDMKNLSLRSKAYF